MIIHRSEKVDDDSIFSAGVPNQVKIVEYPSEIIEDRVPNQVKIVEYPSEIIEDRVTSTHFL